MCVVCVAVAGVVVVSSQIIPAEGLKDQTTLTPFWGTSSSLTSVQKSEIRELLDSQPDANSIVCKGLVNNPRLATAGATVKKRSTAACNYAKRLKPSLEITVVTEPTSFRSNDGKVSLDLVESVSTTSNLVTAASISSDPVSQCRIEEASSRRGATWAGFPDMTPLTTRTGVVKWALIPIDFSDLPGERKFRPRVNKQMKLLSQWMETVSSGRLKVEWVVLNKWARMPGKSSEYSVAQSLNLSDTANGTKLFRHAMDSADPIFDFTGIQTVNFILPKGQSFLKETSQGFPWDEAVKQYQTNEGPISSFSIPGQFFDVPGKTYWSYWAHEFGHAIGLPHVGASRGRLPPFSPWDLMGSQDGSSRELSGWLRFLAGWLPESQIYCKQANSVENLKLNLTPLSSSNNGLKLAIMPISKTKALLIESRRETKFSCKTTPGRNGVLVYVYDATLGHNEDFLIPASPPRRVKQYDSCSSLSPSRSEPNPDFLLRKGDKVVVSGITVEVLKTGRTDTVRVSRK